MMKCSACGHEMTKKKGEIDLRIGGKLYLVRDVPFEECDFCGEKVLSPEVSQTLYKKVENKEYKEMVINIPVLYGTHGTDSRGPTHDNV